MDATRRPVITALILSLICAPLAAQERPPAGGDDKVAIAKERARTLAEKFWNATSPEERIKIIAAIPESEVGSYYYVLERMDSFSDQPERDAIKAKVERYRKADPKGFKEWLSAAQLIKYPGAVLEENLRRAATASERAKVIAAIPRYDLPFHMAALLDIVINKQEADEVRIAALQSMVDFVRTRPKGSDWGWRYVLLLKGRLSLELETERNTAVGLQMQQAIQVMEESEAARKGPVARALDWFKQKTGAAKNLMLSTAASTVRLLSEPEVQRMLADYGVRFGVSLAGIVAIDSYLVAAVAALALSAGASLVIFVAAVFVVGSLAVVLGHWAGEQVKRLREKAAAPPEHSGVNETIQSIP